jgi:transposase
MIRLVISDDDRETIAEALDDPSMDERVKRKLMAIRMHDLNVPHNAIAKTLNITDDTVTNYLKIYARDGLAGVFENRYFQPVSKAAAFFEEIKKSLDEQPVLTVKEASARIKEISGIELSETQTRRIMRQLGLQYRKAAAVPSGADPQLQLDFLAQELLPRLEEAKKGERRVFFVDASHFVLGVFLGMIWCFTRIFIPSASGRKRYNVLGAVETRNHDLVTLQTTGPINAAVVCEFIRKIDRQYPNDEITLVMDNARYQYNATVRELADELNIELLYLPPYSPNLNLIERVWKLVKSKCLRNRYYEDFDSFRGAIDSFLDSLRGANKPLLKSIVTENFQCFQIPKN